MTSEKWTPLERELYEALERLVEQTHQAAVARGNECMAVRMARIHATAVLAKARGEVTPETPAPDGAETGSEATQGVSGE